MIIKPKIGEKLNVSIKKILPIGLAVSLEDGRQGMIRQREISWTPEAQERWRARFEVGQRCDAVLINDSGPQLEFSLRLLESDPWSEIGKKYQIGQVVDGVVTGLVAYGAFIELQPGVTGLLHQSQLPPWATQSLEELFWIGDQVRVITHSIDAARREITLSMRELSARRWTTQNSSLADEVISPVHPTSRTNRDDAQSILLPLEMITRQHLRSILLIEDNTQQRHVIQHELQGAGQRVDTATSAEDALAYLAAARPEIVLSDVGLPGMSGIALTNHILKNHPGIRCVLMTDWTTAEHHHDELDRLEKLGVTLLLRPVLIDDLFGILASTPLEADHTTQQQDVVMSRVGVVQSRSISPQRIATAQALHTALRELRYYTNATKAILFMLDPDQRQVKIIDHVGHTSLRESATIDLLYSPVRNVAEDRKTVQVEDALQAERYVRYLRPLLDFRSCVGVPVPGNLASRYALFLFHEQRGCVGPSIVRPANATAVAVGALLVQQAFLERAADLQRTVLMGRLSRALVHETNHHLSPMLFGLKNIEDQCHRVERTSYSSPDDVDKEIDDLLAQVQQLKQSVQSLVNTTRLFGSVGVQDQEAPVRVDLVVEQCVELMRDLADRAKVELHFRAPNHPLITRVRPTHVQQVFLNVLLNAIQQIQLLRPQEGGNIFIGITLKRTKSDSRLIQVQIEDDGSGIHKRLWQRIFELGVTTRRGQGSGLGLYLAQHLMEEMGGYIYVEDSAMLWGTRVAVEVPIFLSRREVANHDQNANCG